MHVCRVAREYGTLLRLPRSGAAATHHGTILTSFNGCTPAAERVHLHTLERSLLGRIGNHDLASMNPIRHGLRTWSR